MNKGLWNDAEVIDLFSTIEKIKKENKTIKEGFLLHAKKYTRKPNSVRNYYYHEIDNLFKDKQRAKKLGINLANHQKQDISFFSEKETQSVVTDIQNLVNKGLSVRKACLKLSGGNVDLMLRLQNKYRNEILKDKKESSKNTVNILEFKNKQKSLSENDLNSLFMGLVKLVKKTAIEEASQAIRKEKDSISFMLKKTLSDLSSKEKEVELLKEKVLRLEEENQKLSRHIDYKKAARIKLLTEKLAKYNVAKKEIVK